MDKTIVSFLIRAKRATYAGKGAETTPSRTGSHDLVYRENNLMYYDTNLPTFVMSGLSGNVVFPAASWKRCSY